MNLADQQNSPVYQVNRAGTSRPNWGYFGHGQSNPNCDDTSKGNIGHPLFNNKRKEIYYVPNIDLTNVGWTY